MGDQRHLEKLRQGVEIWNLWRKEHPSKHLDLSRADLSGAILSRADLSGAILSRADLNRADLSEADLSETNLSNVILSRAKLSGAKLSGADLRGADLSGVDLSGKDLSGADLSGANLSRANLSKITLNDANLHKANPTRAIVVEANLENAVLSNCSIYGIAAWDVQLKGAKPEDLVITPPDEPTITVDNLEVAQFIYLLLNNPKIRDVINTIGQKVVLILGRFTPERKAVLDAIREELCFLNFLPIVFDFERPTAHDFTETIMTLAGLSCFIIADITNPKSSPLELQATVPNYMTPFVPIIQEGEQPFAMFTDLQNRYRDWVLDTLLYDTPSNLVNVLERAIVQPALARQAELLLIKAQGLRTRHIKDYS